MPVRHQLSCHHSVRHIVPGGRSIAVESSSLVGWYGQPRNCEGVQSASTDVHCGAMAEIKKIWGGSWTSAWLTCVWSTVKLAAVVGADAIMVCDQTTLTAANYPDSDCCEHASASDAAGCWLKHHARGHFRVDSWWDETSQCLCDICRNEMMWWMMHVWHLHSRAMTGGVWIIIN